MNILIVDDDTLIRNWLSMLLHQINGYDLAFYEAMDGIEALEVCASNPIDLVITDIKMPRMDGIELISELKANFPHIRTSVLSSYDDFGYVRIALKCGALDYILKAEMTVEDISALLEKALNDFEMEKTLKKSGSAHYSVLSTVKKDFSAYLTDETMSAEDFLSSTNPALTLERLCIAIFRMDMVTDRDAFQYAAVGICDDTLKGEGVRGVTFPWNRDYFVLIYNYSDTIAENQRAEYLKLLSLLDKNLEKYLGMPISHSINLICRAEDNLRSRFGEALSIMDYRHYYGASAPPMKPDSEQLSGRKELVRSLQKILYADNYERATETLKEHLVRVHDECLTPHRVKRSVIAGMNVFLTSAMLMEAQSDLEDELGALFSAVSEASEAAQVTESVDLFCKNYLSHAHSVSHNVSAPIKLALSYINENYSRKIILDDVAAFVFLNRSYLSQLFKKEIGMAFGDYLEMVRINNAKHLIRNSDKSMSEISDYVGFSNQNYFAKVFKKVTGISPLKYKKR